MNARSLLRKIGYALIAFAVTANVQGAVTDLATAPLNSGNSVLPNVMFVLDDSGSMAWDYMPDVAADFDLKYGYASNQCNGLYYNPRTTYDPPAKADGTSYTASTFTSAWKDGYNTGSGSTNLSTSFKPSAASAAAAAYYYTYNGAQDKPKLKNYYDSGSTFYQECNTAPSGSSYTSTITITGTAATTVSSIKVNGGEILGSTTSSSSTPSTVASNIASTINSCASSGWGAVCVAGYSAISSGGVVTITGPAGSNGFTPVITKSTSGSVYTATITIAGASATTLSSIKVNGGEILGATTSSSATSSTVASNIVSKINSCSSSGWGAVCVAGYSATSSGSVVTITGPAGSNGYTPVITKSGSMTATPTVFASSSSTMTLTPTVFAVQAGMFTKVVVSTTSGDTASGMPADEKENFANWYSYYRTRILMMKSASGLAFKPISSTMRVAFMTINNNVSPDILNWATFDATQKGLWYTKLYGATPGNSTPLREALANVGKMYAKKLTSLYSTTIVDPIQYSCQKNFTILSTDGFWNGNAGFKEDGTAVGNQDGAEPRPYNDGSETTYTKSTSQILFSQTQLQRSTSQLQQRTQQLQSSSVTLQKQISQLKSSTSTLQTRTGQLQKRTDSGGWGGGSWSSWSNTTSCTWDDGSGSGWGGGGTPTQCQYAWGSWSNAASCTVNYSTSTSNGTTWSGNGTGCQYSAWSAGVAASSCTAVAQSGGPTSYTVATARQCTTAVTTPYANAATCDATTTPDASGYTTQCRYSSSAGWVNASSCTPTTQSTGPSYTVATATACQTTDTGLVGVSNCTASTNGTGQTISCLTTTTGPTGVPSCTAAAAAAGNSYTATTCNTATITAATGVSSCTAAAASSGNSYIATLCNTVTTGPTTVTSCTASPAGLSNGYTATTCSAPSTSAGTSDTLADVAEYYYKTDLRTAALGNNTSSATGFVGTDVATNNVNIPPRTTEDKDIWQHMTTFTVGLGVRGSMAYDNPSYWGDTASDFDAVLNGSTANAASGICTWQADGTRCNWPEPVSNTHTAVDDLWHAAVNGRGTYYSAADTKELTDGLGAALQAIGSSGGMAAAATISNPIPSASDNFMFPTKFNANTWDGEVERWQINIDTGAIVADASGKPITDWSARAKLDANTSRTIYTFDPSNLNNGGGSNKLKSFTYANLTATEKTYFTTPKISTSPPSGTTGLTQYLCASPSTCLTSGNQTTASGANLVSYLAGTRTYEGSLTDNTKYYRQRSHMLGDLGNASTVYVQASLPSYTDAGYGTFKSTNATRQGMVYAAANDGMLHAFYAADGLMDAATGSVVTSGGITVTGGDEAWAYIPTMVLPKLYTLADKSYSSKHQFFVDATPVEGDICPTAPAIACSGSQWKTILVGGLGGGGKGYYALDITNPAAPKALWEFTTANDANVGYGYGTPIITKLSDADGTHNGTWVVLLPSGYNNADGVGRLYVLDAGSGALIRTISTGVGSAGTPSGLASITAMVTKGWEDNSVVQVYGGDMLGKLWRFDVNGNVGAAGYDAQLLVSLKGPTGSTQPITAAPTVGKIVLTDPYNPTIVVYVGTGSFLGTSDLTYTDQSTTGKQTMYAIKDPLATGTTAATAIYVTEPHTAGSNFISQTVTNGTCASTVIGVCTAGSVVRTSTNNAVDFASNNGWYIDFPDTGERSNTHPQISRGNLGFVTNVPNSNICDGGGGYSYRWFVNYKTGAPLTNSAALTNTVVGVKSSGLSTGVMNIVLPAGATGSGFKDEKGNVVGSGVVIGSTVVAGVTTCTLGGGCNTSSSLEQTPIPDPAKRTSWRELITE